MTYEELLQEADSHGLLVQEADLKQHDGLIVGKNIGIRKSIETTKEKSCVLAEEIAHYLTTSGNILDQNNTMNRKQELRARAYSYNLKIGLLGIVSAYKAGCRNIYEISEFLDVTEQFLKDALEFYRSKYGLYKEIDNYVIYFIPNLMVLRII